MRILLGLVSLETFYTAHRGSSPCPVNPLIYQSGHEPLPTYQQPFSLLSLPVPATSVLFAMVCVQAFARNGSLRPRRALCLHLCVACGRLGKCLVSIHDYRPLAYHLPLPLTPFIQESLEESNGCCCFVHWIGTGYTGRKKRNYRVLDYRFASCGPVYLAPPHCSSPHCTKGASSLPFVPSCVPFLPPIGTLLLIL